MKKIKDYKEAAMAIGAGFCSIAGMLLLAYSGVVIFFGVFLTCFGFYLAHMLDDHRKLAKQEELAPAIRQALREEQDRRVRRLLETLQIDARHISRREGRKRP